MGNWLSLETTLGIICTHTANHHCFISGWENIGAWEYQCSGEILVAGEIIVAGEIFVAGEI